MTAAPPSSSARAWRRSRRRATRMRRSPRAWRARAKAVPMPLEAPVTSARSSGTPAAAFVATRSGPSAREGFVAGRPGGRGRHGRNRERGLPHLRGAPVVGERDLLHAVDRAVGSAGLLGVVLAPHVPARVLLEGDAG